MTPTEFRASRKRLGLSVAALAEALGMTSRMLNHYASGAHAVPATVALAMEALEGRMEKDRERKIPS